MTFLTWANAHIVNPTDREWFHKHILDNPDKYRIYQVDTVPYNNEADYSVDTIADLERIRELIAS